MSDLKRKVIENFHSKYRFQRYGTNFFKETFEFEKNHRYCWAWCSEHREWLGQPKFWVAHREVYHFVTTLLWSLVSWNLNCIVSTNTQYNWIGSEKIDPIRYYNSNAIRFSFADRWWRKSTLNILNYEIQLEASDILIFMSRKNI